jgi:Tfp pilus assembly protein PilO
MTGRDRMFLIVVSVLAVLAAAWLLVVSPEREKASKLGTQVAAANAQLLTAEGQVASARGAQSQYAAAYASIVNLGKAVPPSQEVPSLIYQLDQVSSRKQVDFFSITAGSGGAAAPASASASASTGPGVAAAGLTQMPFTFVFNGTYDELSHLFDQLNRFTVRTASGGLRVSGRLLTIQSVKLAPTTGSEPTSGKGTTPELTGTVTATAYVLPASEASTSEATPSSPGGATTPAASTGAAPSSPTAPAIARVNP